jgi:hypothetical protein
MNKVKSLMPICLLVSFCLKSLYFGVSWPESITILTLSSIYVISEYFNYNKKIQDFQLQIQALSNKFDGIKGMFEETRGEINALKVKNFTSSTTSIIRK